MDKKSIQDFWLYSNIAFVSNYTLFLLSLCVAFPVPRLPSFFNCFFLIFAYALTFHSLFINFKSQSLNSFASKIFSQPNTFCLFFFATFPPIILLIPFYLLSIYHITSAILSRKKDFENFFFYEIFVVFGKYLTSIGRCALIIELSLTPVCIIMTLFRRCSIFTFISYIFMVRKQCQINKAMRDVLDECIHKIHGLFLKLPDNYKAMYLQAVKRWQNVTKKEDLKKKSE